MTFLLPAAIGSVHVRDLFGYWETVRAGRLAPSWREINPAQIKPVLPYLYVSDVLESPLDLRYRLVGTGIVEAAGRDFTGQTLRTMSVVGGTVQWLAYYRQMVEEGSPQFGRYVGRLGEELLYFADYAGLPLSDDGVKVNRVLEVEDWSVRTGMGPGRAKALSWDFEPI
jgi:hypothetical protein